MASKFRVAVICGIVISISAIILIYASLSSPTQCRTNGGRGKEIWKTEINRTSSPSTSIVHSPSTSGIHLSSGVILPLETTLSAIVLPINSANNYFSTDATSHPPSGLNFPTNLTTHPTDVTTSSNSITRPYSATRSSSGLNFTATSTTHTSSEVLSPTVAYFFPETTSSLNSTSNLTPEVTITQPQSVAEIVTNRAKEFNESVSSSTEKYGDEKNILRVVSSSIPEPETRELLASDLQEWTDEIDISALSEDNSTPIPSPTTLGRGDTRNIINMPSRNCAEGQKKDSDGLCRPIW